MQLLIIGGTRFAGRWLAAQALAAGHTVTLFHRGKTGASLFPEAEHVHGDRSVDVSALAGRRFDAVLDFCGYFPRTVRDSVALLRDSGWYGFVSSISAYADGFPPGAAEDTPLHGPPFPEDEVITEKTYGPHKVACEREVLAGFGERAAIVRPGFIVGPYDPTDRFTSLVRRAAAGGEMLAPGPVDAWLQFVDARDLAAFLLKLAEAGQGGVFDAVHPMHTTTLAQVLEHARAAAEADTTFRWIAPDPLEAALGEEEAAQAFPLWAPGEPAFHALSGARAAAAGLISRPVAETVRDTWVWERTARIGPRHGLSPERERELLARLAGAAPPSP